MKNNMGYFHASKLLKLVFLSSVSEETRCSAARASSTRILASKKASSYQGASPPDPHQGALPPGPPPGALAPWTPECVPSPP